VQNVSQIARDLYEANQSPANEYLGRKEPDFLNVSFNSIYRDSTGDNPRNSSAVPSFHPFFSNIFHFALFI